MRHSLFVALLTIPAVARTQVVARVEDDGIPRVSATASRTARLTPDRVTINAIVEASAETAAEAAQRAERKLQAVTDALRRLDVRSEVVSAMPYGVATAMNYNGYPGQPSPNPFVARYVMRVQPARVDQLMNVTSALISAGATGVGSTAFESAAADSVRRIKFAEALAQARGDAEALAASMGMKLGALIEVSGNAPPTVSLGPSYINLVSGFDPRSQAQLPEVTVSSTVTVRYRLLPR